MQKNKMAFLTSLQAAIELGVAPDTLYRWIRQSDRGEFRIRLQSVTIQYMQGGSKGQGRILIEQPEVERLKGLMMPQPHQPKINNSFYVGKKEPRFIKKAGRPKG